ncbi:integrase, partial [Pseudomonas fluorescens]
MAHSEYPTMQLTPEESARSPIHTAFQPLQQTAFSALEHAAFFKGLLKPFKGKGELMQFGDECSQLMSSLILLATERVLAQAERYPFTLLPIRMTRQSTGAGTVFLRWRRMDRSKMGVDLWGGLLLDGRTPDSLVSDLLAMERQRVVVNMQISLVHSIGGVRNFV